MKRTDVIIVSYNEYIWGVFSNEQKALRAVKTWKLTTKPHMRMYRVNARLESLPPRYLSDDKQEDNPHIDNEDVE